MSTLEERVNAYKEAAQRFDIFDVSLWWAPEYVDTFRPYTDWEKQLKDMEAYGLNSGLFTAHDSRSDPWAGNDAMVKKLEGSEHYYGCAVLVPEMFFEMEKGRAYVKELKKNRVIAARVYPGNFNHSTKEYTLGRMLSVLEEESLPLLVWHIDFPFDAIDELLTNHPSLPVILDTGERKMLYHARDYISLMMAHKNFYVENHNMVLFQEYELIRSLGFVDRIMYGSDFPYFNPDFSIYPVTVTEISDEEKQMIFSGNAKRVFGL